MVNTGREKDQYFAHFVSFPLQKGVPVCNQMKKRTEKTDTLHTVCLPLFLKRTSFNEIKYFPPKYRLKCGLSWLKTAPPSLMLSKARIQLVLYWYFFKKVIMDFSQNFEHWIQDKIFNTGWFFFKIKKREYFPPILCNIMEMTPALKRYLKPLSGPIVKFTKD